MLDEVFKCPTIVEKVLKVAFNIFQAVQVEMHEIRSSIYAGSNLLVLLALKWNSIMVWPEILTF
jgi:hypothetical protein